jgi:hypothetical protein
MKHNFTFVKIAILVSIIFSVSNCSFNVDKVVLDTTYKRQHSVVENNSRTISIHRETDGLSILPSVKSEAEYEPLITLDYTKDYVGLLQGFDYDIILSGDYDIGLETKNLIFGDDNEENLNLFLINYVYLFGWKIDDRAYTLGVGKPLHTIANLNGKKYEVNDYTSFRGEIIRNFPSGNLSEYISGRFIKFKAKEKDSSESINVSRTTLFAGIRVRF